MKIATQAVARVAVRAVARVASAVDATEVVRKEDLGLLLHETLDPRGTLPRDAFAPLHARASTEL